MTKQFAHINEARSFLVSRLSDDTLLGRGGYTMRESLYVLPYDPAQESHAKDLIRAIIDGDLKNNGVNAIEVNLYDIVLKYLDDNDMWEPLCEAEADTDMTKDDIAGMLMDTVNASEVLVPAVNRAISENQCDLVFITGVGETYPYIRTHALLAELETNKPVVLVFPGRYRQGTDGTTSLDILNIPSAANGGYYRATSVFDL